MQKYIKKIKRMIKIFPPRQEGQSGEDYAKQKVIWGVKYGAFALAAFAILRGVLVVAGESVTVSNSVDGRELPIYCVETDEKKIALSFDAAWGNVRLMERQGQLILRGIMVMERKPELYEKKILKDKEFPIQLIVNKCHTRGKYFDVHWHEQIELHYVVRGQTVIRLEQEEMEAKEGSLVIANSNVLHEGYCKGEEMETMVAIFDMEDFSREFADKNIIFRPLISGDSEISGIMLRIYEEYQKKEIGYQLVCKGEFLKLVTYLARNDAVEMLSEEDVSKRRKKLERLNTVYQYIENHYTETITNCQLAELVHLSEGRFCHIFKESTGAAPLQYINEVRLNKAMYLLRREKFTATEAAEAVGFSDYNNFGRMFRRYFGCTPLEARKNSKIV